MSSSAFISWSDPEEMVTLLVEYVEDELSEDWGDRRRREFLTELLNELSRIEDDVPASSLQSSVAELRTILESQPSEFASDPVLVHVDACIEELERIDSERAGSLRRV